MAFVSMTRNFDRVQFEALRREIDGMFNKIHDELSAAYYDYWRHGQSCPWQGFDVQPTKEASKALFEKLHKLIFEHRDVQFHVMNMRKPKKDQIPEEQYNYVYDEEGAVVALKSEVAQAAIDALSAQRIQITLK
jgi:hypothetical protein